MRDDRAIVMQEFDDTGYDCACWYCEARFGGNPELIGRTREITITLCDDCKSKRYLKEDWCQCD